MSLIQNIKTIDRSENIFRDLYESNYDFLLSVCNRYAKNNEEAKLILKEGFIDIFNIVNVWEIDAVEDWMRVMMIEAAVKFLKRNKHEYLIAGTIKALDTYGIKQEEIGDEDVILFLNQENVIEALHKMSPAYRVVINLHLVDGFSFKKIAELLELSEGTAKINYEKAMNAFRNTVKQLSANHA